MQQRAAVLGLVCVIAAGCASVVTVNESGSPLSSEQIVRNAHAAAGGDTWVKPRSLIMKGYGIFYQGSEAFINQRHEMWRVYPMSKETAHQADGMVRIDSYRDERIQFQIAFDGVHTYTQDGLLPGAANQERWQASFGFGVIRFALDAGHELVRLPDDMVDGIDCYKVKVIDPQGGETLFGIAKKDYRIRWLGFDTERGWHERVYSEFFQNPGSSWQQPGRVRLYYNGVKANEIIWQSFSINQTIDPEWFVLRSTTATAR